MLRVRVHGQSLFENLISTEREKMDEEKDKQKTVEVVDTSNPPAEGGPTVKETVEENRARMHSPVTMQEDIEPLFESDAAEKFRTRWLAIQGKFEDDPGAAVQEVDNLVAEVIQQITTSFADRRGTLEKQWTGGGKESTEDLHRVLNRYRSFFERLLSLIPIRSNLLTLQSTAAILTIQPGEVDQNSRYRHRSLPVGKVEAYLP